MPKKKKESDTWKYYDRGLRQWDNVGRGLEDSTKDFESVGETQRKLHARDGKLPMGTINKPKRQKRRKK